MFIVMNSKFEVTFNSSRDAYKSIHIPDGTHCLISYIAKLNKGVTLILVAMLECGNSCKA